MTGIDEHGDDRRTTALDYAAYDATRHWGLPLYNDTTPLDMRDGFNKAMRMLDQILTQINTQIEERECGQQ